MHLNIKKDKESLSIELQSNEKKFHILSLFLILAFLVAIVFAKNPEQFECLNNFINHLAMICKEII